MLPPPHLHLLLLPPRGGQVVAGVVQAQVEGGVVPGDAVGPHLVTGDRWCCGPIPGVGDILFILYIF